MISNIPQVEGVSITDVFRLVRTADGSPSLEWKNEQGYIECMHSRVGALSETEYIYKPVLEISSQQTTNTHLLSLGLGLGYVEMMWAAFSSTHKGTMTLDTFERDEFLSASFLSWLTSDEKADRTSSRNSIELNNPLCETYNEIASLWEKKFLLHAGIIREQLKRAHHSGLWRLYGELKATTLYDRAYNGLFFDPFSKKANPELWTAEFLSDFFNRAADTHCVLSTYAATGELKRQLNSHGFKLESRQGFAGKRQSTFAMR